MKRNTFYLLTFIFIMLFTAFLCYISASESHVYTVKFHESSVTDTLKNKEAVESLLDMYEADLIDEPFTVYCDGKVMVDINE